MRRLRQIGALVVTFGVLAAGAAFAQSDYFGRNPVQWERLKFEVLKTDHFDVYYYDEEKGAAEFVAYRAEFVRGQHIGSANNHDDSACQFEVRGKIRSGQWQRPLPNRGNLPSNRERFTAREAANFRAAFGRPRSADRSAGCARICACARSMRADRLLARLAC